MDENPVHRPTQPQSSERLGNEPSEFEALLAEIKADLDRATQQQQTFASRANGPGTASSQGNAQAGISQLIDDSALVWSDEQTETKEQEEAAKQAERMLEQLFLNDPGLHGKNDVG